MSQHFKEFDCVSVSIDQSLKRDFHRRAKVGENNVKRSGGNGLFLKTRQG
jgi:hypothetical protein